MSGDQKDRHEAARVRNAAAERNPAAVTRSPPTAASGLHRDPGSLPTPAIVAQAQGVDAGQLVGQPVAPGSSANENQTNLIPPGTEQARSRSPDPTAKPACPRPRKGSSPSPFACFHAAKFALRAPSGVVTPDSDRRFPTATKGGACSGPTRPRPPSRRTASAGRNVNRPAVRDVTERG